MDLKLENKVAIVTGGAGAICGEIAKALYDEKSKVVIWDINIEKGNEVAKKIDPEGKSCHFIHCDTTDRESVKGAISRTLQIFKSIDILINGAGGAIKEATTSNSLEFWDISEEGFNEALKLNYMSAIIPSQEVGKIFAINRKGVILNISSIAGIKPITRALGYSNAKAALINFTQWLAVHMVVNYSPNIRVNAIAPGFIITEQNRFLLVDEKSGKLTERGKKVINSVPIKRFGNPGEIAPLSVLLVSELSSFVNGTVIIIDGGLTAFAGI